jgi:arylamine N-acetyltransferase
MGDTTVTTARVTTATAPETSDVDVDAYFKRIGHTGSTTTTVETLQALVAAHTRTIPFENLDPLLGIPVVDLGARALADKLIDRGRGGYCYEHNGLMRYVLTELGFGVEALAGRVVWMQADDRVPARTHQVCAVTVPGSDERYLVDVGFGGQTLSSPIRMVVDEVQATRHEPYRLRRLGGELMLEALVREKWQPLYRFSEDPQPQIDLEVGSWYVSTHPESAFVVGLSAARVTDDARWNLRGRNLAVHGRDGTSRRTRLNSAEEVIEVLQHDFALNIDGLDGLGARVADVLDS